MPSVMTTLPTEILQDIFYLSLAHEDGDGDLSPYFTRPLIVSHVCRYWRQVAISFGTLWTCLKICYDLPRIKYDMIHTWIARTNGLPLDFAVDYSPSDDEDVEQRRTLESVTKLLLAEQHRWRHVHFSWCFKALSPEFTRIDLTDLPMLLSMWLNIRIRKCDDDERIPTNINLARSRLVEDVTFCAECTIEYGTEPLEYLTDGQQYFIDSDRRAVRAAESCLEALRACPNLESFHAVYMGAVEEHAQPEMSGNRPHLVHNIEHLVLDDNGGIFPELVISKVTLPNLRTLDFKTCCFLRTESGLPALFQRSDSRLESLELYGSCAQYNNLIPALRHLPRLQTLIIDRCEDPEPIFEGLSSTVEDDIICPELLCLHLKNYGNPEDVPDPRTAFDALCTMVEFREEPLSPLKVLMNFVGNEYLYYAALPGGSCVRITADRTSSKMPDQSVDIQSPNSQQTQPKKSRIRPCYTGREDIDVFYLALRRRTFS